MAIHPATTVYLKAISAARRAGWEIPEILRARAQGYPNPPPGLRAPAPLRNIDYYWPAPYFMWRYGRDTVVTLTAAEQEAFHVTPGTTAVAWYDAENGARAASAAPGHTLRRCPSCNVNWTTGGPQQICADCLHAEPDAEPEDEPDAGPEDEPDAEPEDEPDAEPEDRPMFGYHETNVLRVHGWPSGLPKDALCFGVELEMEPKKNTASQSRELCETLGNARGDNETYILARDGSLGEGGVELITVPATLEEHQRDERTRWRTLTKSILGIAKSGQGTTQCGMHVHINRAALSPLQVGKMLVFVNSAYTRSLIETIAQRSASSYARHAQKKITDGAQRQSADRYDALNLTANGTCELRIFRGNLRRSRILKNIEFAHALCMYCRDASAQELEKPEKFTAWLETQRSIYPNLYQFLNGGDA